MVQTQVFLWQDGETLVRLEVRHHKFEMQITVTSDVEKKVASKLLELNNEGMYQNEETAKNSMFSQFILSCPYNWNCRWRDFIKILNDLLGINSTEQKEP